MIKVYFFDKDKELLSIITELKKKYEKEQCEFSVIEDYMKFIKSFNADEKAVFFIDMRRRDDDVNCFKLAERVRSINELCHMFFTSFYQEDISLCFKNLIRPSGFLVKPASCIEYESILDLVIQKDSEKDAIRHNKMQILSGGSKYAIEMGNILYFTTSRKKILCKTVDGMEIEFYDTMKNLENKFSAEFIRCHSGFLVNRQAILGLNKNFVVVKNNKEMIPVSKKYRKAITEYLKN